MYSNSYAKLRLLYFAIYFIFIILSSVVFAFITGNLEGILNSFQKVVHKWFTSRTACAILNIGSTTIE